MSQIPLTPLHELHLEIQRKLGRNVLRHLTMKNSRR